MNKKYKIICLECKSECEIKISDTNACNDPDCCGGELSSVDVVCSKCNKKYIVDTI